MSWRRFLKRGRWDRERLEELESYLQMEIDQNVARGMPYAEAHALARRKLGNRTLIREEIYRMNTLAFLDTLIRDVRYSLRALRLNPVFAVVALLTIAIGIGANTAVFSVVNSVLLRPLNYPQSEQLVALRQVAPGVGQRHRYWRTGAGARLVRKRRRFAGSQGSSDTRPLVQPGRPDSSRCVS